MDYKDKIKKLLALAESPVEAEARAAMLKAKELLVKYKVEMSDLTKNVDQDVIEIDTGMTFTARTDYWMSPLSAVIAENYCCIAIIQHLKHKQTQHVIFVGLEQDAMICKEIFMFAVSCIRSDIQANTPNYIATNTKAKRSFSSNYACGYVMGIKSAFEQQKEDNPAWALVLTVPEAAQNIVNSAPIKTYNIHNFDDQAYEQGITDGKKFSPSRTLKGKEPD